MLLTALAVMAESGGTRHFYYQVRVVKTRLFKVIKFRSMRIDAEKDGRARWATRDDDRITRVDGLLARLGSIIAAAVQCSERRYELCRSRPSGPNLWKSSRKLFRIIQSAIA